MSVTPVARDELVYVSADPERLRPPGHRAAAGRGVAGDAGDHLAGDRLDPASCCARCCTRPAATRRPGSRSRTSRPPSSWSASGLADTVVPRGAAEQLLPRLAPGAGWVSLRPRQYDTFAIVHRAGATLSPAARLMIELATARIQAIAEPVHGRSASGDGVAGVGTGQRTSEVCETVDTTGRIAVPGAASRTSHGKPALPTGSSPWEPPVPRHLGMVNGDPPDVRITVEPRAAGRCRRPGRPRRSVDAGVAAVVAGVAVTVAAARARTASAGGEAPGPEQRRGRVAGGADHHRPAARR